ARHARSTPGGNRVAAASLYAGHDPFNNLTDSQTPSCQLNPYPTSPVPIQMIHRACDALVACDEAQRSKSMLPPGNAVEEWMLRLQSVTGTTVGDPALEDSIIDYGGSRALQCASAALCGVVAGTANHLHWPDGVEDGSGQDYEPTMLWFLGGHPLP